MLVAYSQDTSQFGEGGDFSCGGASSLFMFVGFVFFFAF